MAKKRSRARAKQANSKQIPNSRQRTGDQKQFAIQFLATYLAVMIALGFSMLYSTNQVIGAVLIIMGLIFFYIVGKKIPEL
jgi:Flp pilus assembly protein TadB